MTTLPDIASPWLPLSMAADHVQGATAALQRTWLPIHEASLPKGAPGAWIKDALEATEVDSVRDALLAALHEADEARRCADLAVVALVALARHDGASWAKVGAALGCSKQSAHERFAGGRPPAPEHTEPMF